MVIEVGAALGGGEKAITKAIIITTEARMIGTIIMLTDEEITYLIPPLSLSSWFGGDAGG